MSIAIVRELFLYHFLPRFKWINKTKNWKGGKEKERRLDKKERREMEENKKKYHGWKKRKKDKYIISFPFPLFHFCFQHFYAPPHPPSL